MALKIDRLDSKKCTPETATKSYIEVTIILTLQLTVSDRKSLKQRLIIHLIFRHYGNKASLLSVAIANLNPTNTHLPTPGESGGVSPPQAAPSSRH